jgi:Uma2 family endonuclease
VTDKDEADRRSDMTVSPERPCRPVPEETPVSLIDIAEYAAQSLPHHRVEILEGQLLVTPAADGPHGLALTDLTLAFAALHRKDAYVIQGIGLWLPSGDDHAVPDLAVVDKEFRDHEIKYKCYDPAVFRLVLEITSTNWRDDVERKPDAYAGAGVPVYVICDREHGEVIVCTDPRGGEYRTRSVYRKGETFVLPESIGAKVELEVDGLLLK